MFYVFYWVLDFENLNDVLFLGEFLMDKIIIDLEFFFNMDNNVMQVLVLLDNVIEEFGLKEIIIFKIGLQEEFGEKNGNVLNKLEYVFDIDLEEGNFGFDEKDEKEKVDDKENNESLDIKIEDSVLNNENINGENMEKELVVGMEIKFEESKLMMMELNFELKDMEISGKEESDNKLIFGFENKIDGIMLMFEF